MGQRARGREAWLMLGLVTVEERDAPADPFFAEPAARDVPHEATAAQAAAIDAIIARAARADERRTFLLHGVTGSGKTEVYLRAIAAAREAGRGSIVLVPEIALTPQLVARFRARFGDDVAVLHSGLTPRERHAMWQPPARRRGRRRHRRAQRALRACPRARPPHRRRGARPVLQAGGGRPLPRARHGHPARAPGRRRVRPRQRDAVARERAPDAHRQGDEAAPARPRARPADAAASSSSTCGASAPGRRATSASACRSTAPSRRRSRASEQTILFLNRRGFAPSVRCEACGQLATCASCSVALTFHKRAAVVRCHYCDYEAPLGARCGKCDAERARPRGPRHREARGDAVDGVPRGARRAARSRRRERQARREHPRADARAGDRHPRRHADGHQGPRPAARHARGRHQRRRRAQHPRLPRERAHVPAPRPGGRPRRPRRRPRARHRADLRPGAPRRRARGAARRRRVPRARARRPPRARLPAVHAAPRSFASTPSTNARRGARARASSRSRSRALRCAAAAS